MKWLIEFKDTCCIFCFLPSGGTNQISSHCLARKTKLIKMYLQNVPLKKLVPRTPALNLA